MAQDLFDNQSAPQENDLFEGTDLLANPPQGKAAGAGTAFVEGANSMVPFGNRITSAFGAGLYANQMSDKLSDFPNKIREGYNLAQQNEEATKAANPTAYGLGEATGFAGTLPIAPSGYNFIKGAPIAKDASILSRFGNTVGQGARSSLVAAPIGALYGASGAQDVSEMPKEALHGAETAGELGGILPLADSAIGIAGKGVEAITPNIIKNFAKNATTSIEEHANNFWNKRASPDNANRIAQFKYDLADQSGAMLSPRANDTFAQNALNSVMGGEGKYKFTPTGAVKDVLDEINKHQGSALSLKDAQQLEEYINSRITYQPNGILTPESNDLLKIKRALRGTINGATPEDLSSGGNGWNEWNDAKKAYSARGILTDLNNIIDKSVNTDQPANALKRNLSKWSLKSTTRSGLEDTEMDLVKDAIRDNFAKEIMRTGGSRLAPIGATALGMGTGHGFLGAVTGTAGGMGGRNAAFANQLAKIGDIADAVGERLPSLKNNLYQRFEDVPEHVLTPLQIPPKEQLSPLPLTAEELAHARARLATTPQVSHPYSGAPIAPQVNPAGSLTKPIGPEGYGMSMDDLYGNNPNEPDIGAYTFPKKNAGGSVKRKIGFNLKKKNK